MFLIFFTQQADTLQLRLFRHTKAHKLTLINILQMFANTHQIQFLFYFHNNTNYNYTNKNKKYLERYHLFIFCQDGGRQEKKDAFIFSAKHKQKSHLFVSNKEKTLPYMD